MSGPVYLHETDSHGFPRCPCPACRERSKTMNVQYQNRMFGSIFTRGHDEQQEKLDRDQDYEGGMK